MEPTSDLRTELSVEPTSEQVTELKAELTITRVATANLRTDKRN